MSANPAPGPLTDPDLTREERSMLEGHEGPGAAMAMRVVVSLARVRGARQLIQITRAHIDSCLFHGQAGLDFAERLGELGAQIRVPATLNVGSLDLLHPGLVREQSDAEKFTALGGRRLMDAYLRLGAQATWTCAPYQLDSRPSLGEHVAWAESNAIVFANSVLGARTDRYGDFLDVCAAVTGRAPLAGLHTDMARRGEVLVDCRQLSSQTLGLDLTYPLLGYLVGSFVGTRNPVLLGLPTAIAEDHLKAFGAAAASSGGVGLFHAVGITPEAPSLDAAFHGGQPDQILTITSRLLRKARAELSTAKGSRLDAISVGTPHASVDEITALCRLLESGPPLDPHVAFYLSTGRSVLTEAGSRGLVEVMERAGVRIVVDTCTYVTSILKPGTKVVMTNSGKWAHYAPANLGIDVVLGSLAECVESARAAKVVRDDALLT